MSYRPWWQGPAQVIARPKRLSLELTSLTAASQRLTNTEATDPTLGLKPADSRRLMPRKNAPAVLAVCRNIPGGSFVS